MSKQDISDHAFSLLELLSREEIAAVEQHQRRVQFFVVLMSTLVGAVIAGLLNTAEIVTTISLVAVPVVIIFVAEFGKSGTYRVYQRLLETIAMRAKVEQMLGMTSPTVLNQPDTYWSSEPLVMQRHLEDRQQFSTSLGFIRNAEKHGYHSVVKRLFVAFQLLAGALVLTIFAQTYFIWMNTAGL